MISFLLLNMLLAGLSAKFPAGGNPATDLPPIQGWGWGVQILLVAPCYRSISLDVNFCNDHRDKIEVPDPLAVKDLISSKLNNKRKLARLITQEKIYPYTV